MYQDQKSGKSLHEYFWGKIQTGNLSKVDNARIDRLMKGGYLFGFTASDLLIILSSILTLLFLQIQPYLIPFLEGKLDSPFSGKSRVVRENSSDIDSIKVKQPSSDNLHEESSASSPSAVGDQINIASESATKSQN